jgi:hypothetical protein
VRLTTQLHLVLRSGMHAAVPPLLLYVFMVWCLVKHRDNFTFILILRQFELTETQAYKRTLIVAILDDSLF